MKKPLALLVAGFLLSGCVAAPPTDPQVTKLSAADAGLGAASAPAVAPDWWTAFGDPQLDRLVARALADNPTLAGALARMRAAEAVFSSSRAADYPQANLDGQEQRQLFSKDYIIPPPYGGTWRWFGSLTTNLSWNLDFWGKQAALIAQARDKSLAAALDADAARLALSGAFAQAYINLLLNYQYGDIADATVREREEILKIARGRFDAGLENGSDVAQARSLLSIARADQLRFAAAREMAVHASAALAGEGADA